MNLRQKTVPLCESNNNSHFAQVRSDCDILNSLLCSQAVVFKEKYTFARYNLFMEQRGLR